MAVALAAMTLGCSRGPSATAAGNEEKAYTLTPVAVRVKTGFLTGEVTEMKVTERIEQGSIRIVSLA